MSSDNVTDLRVTQHNIADRDVAAAHEDLDKLNVAYIEGVRHFAKLLIDSRAFNAIANKHIQAQSESYINIYLATCDRMKGK